MKGDGDVVWAKVLADCSRGSPRLVYEGGRIDAADFLPARWDLVPGRATCWRRFKPCGCTKHCSFCSVWRTDGQRPRQRSSDVVVEEIVQLRRLGFRFIALADDNFYPVTLSDIRLAEERNNTARLNDLKSIRAERFALMERLIATDSARVSRSAQWARWLAKPCQRLFAGPPMPALQVPTRRPENIGMELSTLQAD